MQWPVWPNSYANAAQMGPWQESGLTLSMKAWSSKCCRTSWPIACRQLRPLGVSMTMYPTCSSCGARSSTRTLRPGHALQQDVMSNEFKPSRCAWPAVALQQVDLRCGCTFSWKCSINTRGSAALPLHSQRCCHSSRASADYRNIHSLMALHGCECGATPEATPCWWFDRCNPGELPAQDTATVQHPELRSAQKWLGALGSAGSNNCCSTARARICFQFAGACNRLPDMKGANWRVAVAWCHSPNILCL